MTRTTSARIAGLTYLFYIAAAFSGMVLFDRATRAEGIAAELAGIAQHASDIQIAVVLSLLTCFAALVLAVTLYRITRDEDHDVAMLALTCGVSEGVLGTTAGANAPDAAAAHTLGAFLFKVQDWNTIISATFFAAWWACPCSSPGLSRAPLPYSCSYL